MKQLKEYIKKNTLLGLAICLTLSSIAWGCSACEPEEEKNECNITLEGHKGDIKGAEVATIKLTPEGFITFGKVVLKFTNHADFVKEDGKTLSETMKLHDFLGKEEEEEMDGPVELKVKAAPATQTGTADKTLKMAVGDEDNPNEFVSETDVVSWKATLSAPSPLSLTAPGTIYGMQARTSVLKNNGFITAKQQNVHCRFEEAACFEYSHNGTDWVDVQDNMTLQQLTKAGDDDPIGDSVNLKFRRKTGFDKSKKTLAVTIGSTAGAADYLPTTNIVTWKPEGLTLTSDEATVTADQEVIITLTAESDFEFDQKDVHFQFTNLDELLQYSSDDGGSWGNVEENMLLHQLTGSAENTKVLSEVKLKFKMLNKAGKKNHEIGIRVGSSSLSKDDFYKNDKILTYNSKYQGDLQINATFESPNRRVGEADIHEHQVIKVNLTPSGKDVASVKFSEITVKFKEGTCEYIARVSDLSGKDEVVLSKEMALNELLKVDGEKKLNEISEINLFFKVRSDYKATLQDNQATFSEMKGQLEYDFFYQEKSIPSDFSKHQGLFTFKTGHLVSWKSQV